MKIAATALTNVIAGIPATLYLAIGDAS